MTRETVRRPASGGLMLLLVLVLFVASIYVLITGARQDAVGLAIAGALGCALTALLLPGFFVVQPNQAAVLVFFGSYVGSVKTNGFFWVNPFTTRK